MDMNAPPAYMGMSFTPTIHSSVPPNLDPSKVTLPAGFVAAITGAGKGLGYQMALSFARAGATGISISSRTGPDLDGLETAIHAIDPKVKVLKTICDTTSSTDVARLASDIASTFDKRLDVLIANAGIISKHLSPSTTPTSTTRPISSNLPIGILEDTDWQRVLTTNLHGTWLTIQHLLPLLISPASRAASAPATIIVSSSLAAHSPSSLLCPVAYNISKFAVTRLVEHIASDHARDGIQAFALHPGAVLTPQTVGHAAEGGVWEDLLGDDEALAGAFCVWLSRERREWLSGRLRVGWTPDSLSAWSIDRDCICWLCLNLKVCEKIFVAGTEQRDGLNELKACSSDRQTDSGQTFVSKRH
ncbi:NAD(P)-binding protein [Aaosphaeria arxii CBS 175.79]|uniref:NAD(P)-binding protein n=1 Tax=Aaosphaeria arxii CBS 175.79 TaxID=1450172 RepID=A0A6A5XMI2_9PLEO|nr:NAD(P)-binding protein [Aaosphaeria arxii CBS 175.79]KAF2014021.1 NAD(P)-binding protein [Aaosphaeria arxii CBS 175.79]